MMAAGVVVLLLVWIGAGVVVAGRQRAGSMSELGALVGRVVEVSSASVSRGPVKVASVEGTLVEIDGSYLVLRPKAVPIPPRFARMEMTDGTVWIPVHDVLDVTCAGQVVRLR